MSYQRLSENFRDFVDRFYPDLSNLDNALSALRSIDLDPKSSPEEKEALRAYVGNHNNASKFNYHWCEECDSMIGLDSHVHCPICIYPCVTTDADPANGISSQTTIKACENCGACCYSLGHRACSQCNTHITKACRHCNNCSSCCKCNVCPDCNELQECECRRCYEHCNCAPTRPHPIYGKSFPAFKHKERKLFNSTRLAGVEWEYNRLKTNKYINHWAKKWIGEIHEDASCGWEAVTPPVAGDYMVNCLTALGSALNKGSPSCDSRCSIHVHTDAKDLQWADMLRLLSVYSHIEPVLYMIAGQDRLTNRYCLPCGKEYATALKRSDQKGEVMAVAFNATGGGQNGTRIPFFGRISQRQRPGRRADVHRHARRRGLNILPWLAGRGPRPLNPTNVVSLANENVTQIAKRIGISLSSLIRWNKNLNLKPDTVLNTGTKLIYYKRVIAPDTTIEFRLHPNTLDTERVINWTKLVIGLVDWVVKHSDKDVEKLSKSPLRALCQIVPDSTTWILHRVREWRKETSRSYGVSRLVSLKGGKYNY